MNLHKIVAKLLSTKMIKNNWIKIYLLVNRTQFKHKLNYKLIILNQKNQIMFSVIITKM